MVSCHNNGKVTDKGGWCLRLSFLVPGGVSARACDLCLDHDWLGNCKVMGFLPVLPLPFLWLVLSILLSTFLFFPPPLPPVYMCTCLLDYIHVHLLDKWAIVIVFDVQIVLCVDWNLSNSSVSRNEGGVFSDLCEGRECLQWHWLSKASYIPCEKRTGGLVWKV